MPKPSVALWRAKPITSVSASATSPLPADWPMARPSEKLCRPMPVAIMSASQAADVKPDRAGTFELGSRCSARAEHLLAALGADPAVVVDEAHQPDAGAEREQRSEPRELEPRPALVDGLLERLLHRHDPVGKHVVEQEEEDARRHAAEGSLQAHVGALQPSQRQTDEDRHAGEGAEYEDLRRAQVKSSCHWL